MLAVCAMAHLSRHLQSGRFPGVSPWAAKDPAMFGSAQTAPGRCPTVAAWLPGSSRFRIEYRLSTMAFIFATIHRREQ